MKALQSPFAHLSRLDLLTAQDLRLWAGSSLGQAVLSTLRPEPEPYAPGLEVRDGQPVSICSLSPRKANRRAQLRAEAWYKDRQAIQALKSREKAEQEILFGQIFSRAQAAEGERLRRLATLRQPEPWRFGSSAGYRLPKLGRYILDPHFEPDAKPLRQRLEMGDALAGYVHSIALQCSAAAIRAIRNHGEPSQAGQDDALLCAIEGITERLYKLCLGDWARADRLAKPAFADRTLLSERARRRYLFRWGYRRAYRSLSALPAGMTGRKASLFLCELTEWGNGSSSDAEAETRERYDLRQIEDTRATDWETLPCDNAPDRMIQARVLAWQRLVMASPFAKAAAEPVPNKKHIAGYRAAVRRWAVFVRLLQGESQEKAAERCGFGPSFVINGKLAEVIQQAVSMGVSAGGSDSVRLTFEAESTKVRIEN